MSWETVQGIVEVYPESRRFLRLWGVESSLRDSVTHTFISKKEEKGGGPPEGVSRG